MIEEKSHPFDLRIFTAAFILIGIGVAFMYGASARVALLLKLDQSYFFYRQLSYGIIALFTILFVAKVNPKFFFRLANPLLIFSLLFIVLVLIPGIGIERNGQRRWISLGFFNFQPSEFAKIALILFLSKKLALKENNLNDFVKDGLGIIFTIVLFFVLVFVEKDLSSAFVILASAMTLVFVAGLPIRFFVYIGIIGTPVFYFLIMTSNHMRQRLTDYFKKFFLSDAPVHGQEKTAVKAISNADLFGNGFGVGSFHSRIPESHTDFYFASVVADIGLIGGLIVFALFIYLYLKIFKISHRLKDKRQSYLVYGLTLTLIWQTLINLGSVLGLLPITGLPLPFLSFGGNSIFFTSIAIGIILSISRFTEHE